MSGTELDGLSPAKRALYELRMLRERLAEHERAATEPIAILGSGLRFPGGVSDPEAYWRLMDQGFDTVVPIPPNRWDTNRYFSADPHVPGRMFTREGAFLRDVETFDPAHFGISPREAESMDPQHWLLLETAWEAFERAGVNPHGLAGSDTGVFVGMSNSDYGRLAFARPESIDLHAVTGTNYSVAAGRLSFLLGLHGPSMVVDTACSGSLVAVHLACRSLRAGECRLAIAGGVNLILSPEVNINFCKAGMLSRDHRCKTFDAKADGFVRGEGCGVVVLKRLSDAIADGDNVLAVIRGSAVNQDGRSSGLTAPNGAAQEAVIRQALEAARLKPHEIDYVEAHGTGTALGDPIEARALGAALGEGRSRPLVVGSVKTNIGHLEAAAGIAGLIKVVLSMQNERIPAHLHFQEMNPHIDWNGMAVEIPVSGKAWAKGEEPRRAGISSFGFSGTNAHVIVEEAPAQPRQVGDQERKGRKVQVLALSGRTERALAELTERYAGQVAGEGEWGDLCYTANRGRARFAERAVYVAETQEELARQLGRGEALVRGHVEGAPEVVFLFTGQGAQYAGMGRELYETEPVFAKVIEECGAWELLYGNEALWSGETGCGTGNVQVAIFALQCGLAALWRSWGVEPAVVLGHSVGEYAAGCVAGLYSMAEGLRLIRERERLTGSIPSEEGAMGAVLAPEDEVRRAVGECGGEVSIAAYNGPENVVISGRAAGVEELLRRFAEKGYRTERLRVRHGFHSALMEEASRRFGEEAARTEFQEPVVSFVSSVLGREAKYEELSSADYWRRQVRESVRYGDALRAVSHCKVFVEIGPGSTLLGMGREGIGRPEQMWGPSIRRSKPEGRQMAETLAALYVNGVPVNWEGYYEGRGHRPVSAPTYPFERQRCWILSKTDERATPEETWESLLDTVRHQSGQCRLDLDLKSYSWRWQALNELSLAYLQSALCDLGAFRVCGERHTAHTLIASCGIQPGFEKLISRWLRRLNDAGLLEADGQYFVAAGEVYRPDPTALLERLRPLFGSDSILLEYVAQSGAKLREILLGSLSSLETLFPNGEISFAEDLYERSPVSQYFADIARAGVTGLLRLHSSSVRVLEIGAGTGATTSALVPALKGRCSEYLFTDVSDLFLQHGARKFVDYPFVRFQRLDISQPISELTKDLGSFDLIVATNVLHATPDIDNVLRTVRGLLAPGGHVIVCEATTYFPWFDVTTGLIEGWQLFQDKRRGDHPLLDRSSWISALDDAGFARSLAVPEPGAVASLLGQHVLFAQNPGIGIAHSPAAYIPSHVHLDAAPKAAFEIADFASAPDSERRERLTDLIRAEVAAVLHLADQADIDVKSRFVDLGIDSLMAVEARARLSRALGLERALPATLLFEHPSVASLVNYFDSNILGISDKKVPVTGPSAFVQEIENMSDSEAEELLLLKLQSI